MKKSGFGVGMLTMFLLMVMINGVAAKTGTVTQELTYNNIGVFLDGEKLDLLDANGNSVEPFAFNGTNYLPVRAIGEALGLNVSWDKEKNAVILSTKNQGNEESDSSMVQNKTVYITRTGKRYHFNSSCNGGTYYASTLQDALSRGLTPCEKCVQ